jgi:hypothetical protein
VGVNTTSPGARFSLTQSGATSADGIRIVNGGTTWNQYSDASGRLLFASSGGAQVAVQDNGLVGIGTTSPANKLHVVGADGGAGVAMIAGASSGLAFQSNAGSNDIVGRNAANSAYENIHIRAGASNQLFASTTGNVGIGTTSPAYPLHMGSGAYVTTGGVWTNASSRAYKKDIAPLGTDRAVKTLKALQAVTFKYRKDDEPHVGFIAEDVPEIVATKDRKGLSAMDIVAVLTKVVQQQQEQIEAQQAALKALMAKVEGMEKQKDHRPQTTDHKTTGQRSAKAEE